MEKTIICRIDNKTVLIKHLARHLKIHHKKDYKEYISENLDDFKEFGWNKCPYSGKIIKGKVSPEFTNQYIGDLQRGIPKGAMKEETKKKLSDGRKGKKHWNYGKKLGPTSEETKGKISKANKGKQSWLNRHHSDETKEKLSIIKTEYYKTHDGPMKNKTHSAEAIEKIFAHRKMNKLEQIVATEFINAKIDYHFQFFMCLKSYDFKIKGKNILIEIDGDYWHGNPNTKYHFYDYKKVQDNDKLKEEIAKENGFKLFRFWESDIKQNSNIIVNTIKEYL